jgi:hypothetical protein
MEEVFKLKGFSADGKDRKSDANWLTHAATPVDDKTSDKDKLNGGTGTDTLKDHEESRSESGRLEQSSFSHQQRLPNLGGDPLRPGGPDRGAAVNDFWNRERMGYQEPRNDADFNRRTEFRQLLENRSTIDTSTALGGAARSSGGIADTRGTFGNQGYQDTSGALSRSSAFSDASTRSFGANAAAAAPVRVEPVTVRAQPAVLPFPARPGELFKRPGQY